MRIAHALHGLGLGGAQQVVRSLVGGASRDVESLVYSPHGGVFADLIAEAGARVHLVPRVLPKLDPLWVRRLARRLRDDRIDLLHCHLFGDSLHGYLAARRVGLPVVMTLHNATVSRSRFQLLGYRWLLRRRHLVPVACAEFVRRSHLPIAGPAADRILTISNGIASPADAPDPAAARRRLADELDLDATRPIVGAVGRLVEQKGYADLIDALAATPDDVQLMIFGDGPLRAELETRAAERGVGTRVRLAGFRADVAELLPGLDAIVFSSLWEGLPIALLEAMAEGRAIVATAVGGMPDALGDDVEALLAPPRDPLALGRRIARVAGDTALRRRLGSAARERFRAEFTAERMVERYESLYREVLGVYRL